MVNLNVNNRYKRTEKVSLYVFFLSIQHLPLLTRILLHPNYCAVDLAFKQTVWCWAVVPVDVVVRELRIIDETDKSKKKRHVLLFVLLSNIFPF